MTQSPKTSTPKSSTPKAPTSGSSPAGVGSPSPIPLSASFYGSGPSPSLRSTPPISPSIWQRPLRQVRRRRAVPTSPPPITPPSTPRGRPSKALRRGGGRRRRGGPGRGPPAAAAAVAAAAVVVVVVVAVVVVVQVVVEVVMDQDEVTIHPQVVLDVVIVNKIYYENYKDFNSKTFKKCKEGKFQELHTPIPSPRLTKMVEDLV